MLWGEVLSFLSGPPLPWTSYCIWRSFSLGSWKACTVLGGLGCERWRDARSHFAAGPTWQQSFMERKRVYPACVRQKWKRGLFIQNRAKTFGTLKEVTYLLKVVEFFTKWYIQHDTSCQTFRDKLKYMCLKHHPNPPPPFNFVQGITYLSVVFLNVPLWVQRPSVLGRTYPLG